MYCCFVWLLSLNVIILRSIHIPFVNKQEKKKEPGSSLSYGYTTICLSIHLLMDIWVVSRFLAIIYDCYKYFFKKSLYGHMFWFLLGKHLGVERQDHIWKVYVSLFRNHPTIFQSGYTILHFYPHYMKIPVLPYPCQNLVWSVVLIFAILIGM